MSSVRQSVKRMQTVAVLLPQEEPFDHYNGGAIARWVNETYRLITTEQCKYTVFSITSSQKTRYSLNQESNWIGHLLPKLEKNNWFVRKVVKRKGQLWCFSLRKQLSAFDVIHVHNRPKYVIWLRKNGYQGQIVLHMHNNHVPKLNTKQIRQLSVMVDRVLTVSDFIRQQIMTVCPALGRKCYTVYNGVNTERFKPNSRISKDSQYIVFVGRVVRNKGVHVLLDAISQLLAQGIKLKLSVIGASQFGGQLTSDYERACIKQADTINQNYHNVVKMHGYMANEQLCTEINRAAIFCAPYLWDEPFGLAPLEAMATRTAVVATRSGALPEVIGNAGMLVAKNDPVALAAALKQLLEQPALRQELSAAAQLRVKNKFSWHATAQSTLDHLLTAKIQQDK